MWNPINNWLRTGDYNTCRSRTLKIKTLHSKATDLSKLLHRYSNCALLSSLAFLNSIWVKCILYIPFGRGIINNINILKVLKSLAVKKRILNPTFPRLFFPQYLSQYNEAPSAHFLLYCIYCIVLYCIYCSVVDCIVLFSCLFSSISFFKNSASILLPLS